MAGLVILVDLYNLHIGLERYYLNLPPACELARAIRYYAESLGNPRHASVYCNWNDPKLEGLTREFSREGFEPVQVTPKGNSRDRTDLRLSLDALEYSYSGYDSFLFVAGDADYVEVIQKLKRRNAAVHACAPAESFSQELMSFVDSYRTIEEVLEEVGYDLYPLLPLLKLLKRLEKYHSSHGGVVGATLYTRKAVEDNLWPRERQMELLNLLDERQLCTFVRKPLPKDPEQIISTIELNTNHYLIKSFIESGLL